MAKFNRKGAAAPATEVPFADLISASDERLAETYSREQVWASLGRLLDSSHCPQTESLFERAVHWKTPASPAQRVAWVNRYVAAHRGIPDAVPWWDVTSREWIVQWARKNPDELRETRERLLPPLEKLADFCLAVTVGAAMPAEVAAAVAKHFLNAPPGNFAYQELFSTEQLAGFAEHALTQTPFPILRRERVAELSARGGGRLRLGLAVNYCASDFRAVGVGLLLGGDVPDIEREVVGEWAARTKSPEGLIVLSLVYARLYGEALEELPAWAEQALLLDLRSGSLDDVDVTRLALLALPQRLARRLLAEALREERATLLIPALADEALLHEFLTRVEAGDVGRETAVEALGHCGAGGLSALLSFPGCAKSTSKISANLGVVVAEALLRLLPRAEDREQRRRAAAVLVPWLGHASKVVASAAKRTLEWLGGEAEGALAAGTQSGKKQVRQESERLLERLTQQQPVVRTPLDDVSSRARQDQELGEQFQSLCQQAVLRSETWDATVRPAVEKYGALCLEWLRPWFEEHVPQGDVRLWCYVVDLLSLDNDAVWVAVDTFARMPKLPTSLWARPRRALSKLGDKLAKPAKHVLTHGHTEYAEPIYGLLAAYAGEEAIELLLTALSSDSKAIRGHAVDGLSRHAGAPLAPVLALLGAASPGVRISAAELLAVWGRSESREALAHALASETRAPVRAYLEEALAATGAQPLLDEIGPGTLTERTPREIDECLEQALRLRGKGVNEPRFLLDHPLPPLQFKSGRSLSREAALGFLSLVTELDSTLKGRLVRQVSSALEASNLAAWSRHLHDRWNRSKDTKFKYAVYQVWLLADETLIDEVGGNVRRLRANEHVVVACYLRVLHWRASPRALDWLVHWANSLPSRGARSLAQTLLGRVAYRTGKSLAELRQAADRWIHQRSYEQELANKAELERFDTDRFVQYLEDCVITGRGWSWTEWSALHDRFPELFKRLVWRVKLDSAGSQVFEPALSRRGLFQSGAGDSVEGDSVSEISLAHPLGGTKEEWMRVRQWLGERANEPLLLQWDRPAFTHGGDNDMHVSELSTDSERLDRWIKRRGWFHGEPLDHGLVYSNTKTLGARGLVLHLNHSGYPIGQHEFAERVQLLSLEVTDLDGHAVAISSLEPRLYSELCYQLSQLAAND